jgi:hypothetical protein
VAARTATKKAAAKKKAAPVVEAEEILEDEEFEEVEEGEVEEAPAKKKASGRPTVDFGIRQVCDILSEKTGKDVNPRELRTLARRLAKDDTGRIDREIVAGNRTMYSWSGPKDPEVVALIAAYMAGEGEIEKKAKLDALKAKREAAPKATKKTTTKKAAKKPAPVAEEVDEDEELDFDEDDE